MLVRATRQTFTDNLGYLGKGHLDPLTVDTTKMPFQTLVLLAPHHEDIMLGTTRDRKIAKVRGNIE